MGEQTDIAWTNATFNPVWGCTAVSPACDHCYAEAWARRFGVKWGPHGTFREFGDAHWREPLKWNRQAAASGQRRLVFCASMADVFDNRWPPGIRERLWELIRATPHLTWQLLTKRPQNIARMLPPDWGDGYPNVWLGTTVENQTEADRRIPHLLRVPARVRFLSCEPLLGAVDLTPEAETGYQLLSRFYGPEGFDPEGTQPAQTRRAGYFPRIDWIIIGGESGPGARPMQRQWITDLLQQAWRADVPAFVKQLGARWPGVTKAGTDPAEWPPELRVQQFPRERVDG